MISVENFYWVLFESLLDPSGLDCHYHYPFGSKKNLSRHEYIGQRSPWVSHVLFYYDQEPIYTTEVSEQYDIITSNWSRKICRILANSEHSKIKKSLCQQRHMLDWYFFYHGFAALDWFRDAQYVVNNHTTPKNVYLNLNHQIQHYRSYRISLLARLSQQDLLRHGTNSFHGDWPRIQQEILDPNSMMSPREKLLATQLKSVPLPIIADSSSVASDFSARFGGHEMELWQKSVFHIVNETVFYQDKLHLTEKIFKPIVACRPFVLVAAPGNLEYLRSYGFQTFGDWIDESYDQETDPGRRLDLIAAEIQKLCDMSMPQLLSLLKDMQPVLTHNKNHFFGDFREIILREMLDNFARCIIQWNNGRLESGVQMPDLDQVYKTLIQR